MNLLGPDDLEKKSITKPLKTSAPTELLIHKTNIDNPTIMSDLTFICDSSLSRVAKHLRMMGYDCVHEPNMTTNFLIFQARRDSRIILTRSRKLLKMIVPTVKSNNSNEIPEDSEEVKLWMEERKKRVEKTIDIEDSSEEEEEENPVDLHQYPYLLLGEKTAKGQICEVVSFFQLEFDKSKIFSRCLECNSIIFKVDKDLVKDKVYLDTWNAFEDFYFCKNCNKVYWGVEKGKETVNYLSALKFVNDFSYKEKKKE